MKKSEFFGTFRGNCLSQVTGNRKNTPQFFVSTTSLKTDVGDVGGPKEEGGSESRRCP